VISRALQFTLAPGVAAAIAVYELVEVLDNPPRARFPFGPAWANDLITFHGAPLAVIDLAQRAQPGVAHARAPWVMIAAYQTVAGAPLNYGAIAIASVPQNIVVDDAHAVNPGETWDFAARAAFDAGSGLTPILDLKRLFFTA
jgi:chemotaxis signal transduction protein